jgi:hypothetical protein
MRIGLEQTNVATMSKYNKCECLKNICSCCADIDIEKLNFNQTGILTILNCVQKLKFKTIGCLNFTYNPSDFALKLDLLMSNHSIFSARFSGKKKLALINISQHFIVISGKNPPPLCIPIPQLPILSMCIRLTEIHTDEDQNLFACLNMELQLQGTPLVIFSFDCASFGPNGITLVKPSPRPPSENGQLDLDLSMANLEQALKGNVTTTTGKPGGWPSFFELTKQNGQNATKP